MTTFITAQKGRPAWHASRLIASRLAGTRKDWSRWLLILAGCAVGVAWLWFAAYSDAALLLLNRR